VTTFTYKPLFDRWLCWFNTDLWIMGAICWIWNHPISRYCGLVLQKMT